MNLSNISLSVPRFILKILYPNLDSRHFVIYLFIRYCSEKCYNTKYGKYCGIGYKFEVIPSDFHRRLVKQFLGHSFILDDRSLLIVPLHLFEKLFSENIFYRDGKTLWVSVQVLNLKQVLRILQGNKLKCNKYVQQKRPFQVSPSYNKYSTKDNTENLIYERIVQVIPHLDSCLDCVYLTENELFNIRGSEHAILGDIRLQFKPIRSTMLAPKIASEMIVQMISPSVYIGTDIVEIMLNKYFQTPKILHENDCFGVDLTEEFTRHIHWKYLNALKVINKIYFKCVLLKCNDVKCTSMYSNVYTNFSYYVVKGETNLIQEQNMNSYIPPQKYLRFLLTDDEEYSPYEIAKDFLEECPYGLDKYLHEISTSVEPFVLNRKVNLLHTKLKCSLQPVFLLRGEAGGGCQQISKCLAGHFGLNFFPESSRRLIATTSKQTEAKLDALFQKAKNIAPVLIHLEDFNVIGIDAETNEDMRIVDYFIKKLKELYENFTKFPIIFIMSCDNSFEFKSNLFRIFLEEFRVQNPNREERLDMLIWLAVSKNVIFHDENFENQLMSCTDVTEILMQFKDFFPNNDDLSKTLVDESICDFSDNFVNNKTLSVETQLNILLKCSCILKKSENFKTIVKKMLSENIVSILDKVSSKTESFLFGDFVTLVDLAIYNGYMGQKGDRENYEQIKLGSVREKDFEDAIEALRIIQSKKLGTLKVPNIQWDDIGGLEDLKKEIYRTIELPLRFPHFLAKSGLRRSGLLLWGPPGCGKTLVARAIASQLKAAFLSVKGPELLDMYVGQSEKNMRDMFTMARASAPCVIFLDEAEAAAGARGASGDAGGAADRLVSQLLAELDGVSATQSSAESGPVIVIAATNRPDLVEPALLRPGRLDKLLYVGPYSGMSNKVRVLRAASRVFNLSQCVNLEEVANHLPEKCTGADLAAIVNRARRKAMARAIQKAESGDVESSKLTEDDIVIFQTDFEDSINGFVPSISNSEMDYYESLKSKLS